MTDCFHTLTVVLERDTRNDDCEPLIEAIKQLRGVLSVEGQISDYRTHMAEQRARRELGEKLFEVLHSDK